MFYVTSFKKRLHEDGRNRWPKHVGGCAAYNTINLHKCICTDCFVSHTESLIRIQDSCNNNHPIVGAAEGTCGRSPLPQYEEVEIAFHKWLQMQEPDF